MARLFDGIRATLAGVALAVCVSSGSTAGVTADGTGFTFQGKLSDAGAPVAEAVDLRFRLYDDASGGVQVGPELTLTGVSVSEGVFAADLDFGAQFMGAARWLEVDVRLTAMGGSYTTLSPRQLIKPAPTSQFAMQAGTVDWSDITGMPANLGTWERQGFNVYRSVGNVGVGTSLPQSGLHLQNGSLWINGATGGNLPASAGSGLRIWNEGGLGLPIIAGFDYASLTPVDILMQPDGGRVGVNTLAPQQSLHVNGAARVGGTLEFENTAEGSLWSIFPASNNRLGFRDAAAGQTHMVLTEDGDLGLGTTLPFSRLDVQVNRPNQAAIYAVNSGLGATSVGALASVSTGIGLYGEASSSTGSNYGVYGFASSPSAYGVFAAGRLGAAGTKSFMIDHPTNPEEQFLLHYSTENPEPQNAYNGVAVLDAQGQAWVRLPDYFEAINTDYRYQLTSIGGPAAVYIAREIEDNAFLIGGGSPGMKVSWEVKARRADRYVERMGAPVELDKTPAQRGLYLMPELYDQPREKAINHRAASRQAATSGEASGVSERN